MPEKATLGWKFPNMTQSNLDGRKCCWRFNHFECFLDRPFDPMALEYQKLTFLASSRVPRFNRGRLRNRQDLEAGKVYLLLGLLLFKRAMRERGWAAKLSSSGG